MKKRQYNGRHYYTDEEKQWLIDNGPGMTQIEVTEAFNKRFGLNQTMPQIRNMLSKLGIHLGRKPKYTQEIHDIIRHCYCDLKMTSDETMKEVQKVLGEDVFGFRQMHNYISNYKIKNGMSGRPTRTMFEKGKKPLNLYPKGTILFQGKKRRIKLIKVDDHDGWEIYNRWLWQQHHGPIPDGYIVLSLSRTEDVTDVNDLICVPKGDAAKNWKAMVPGESEYNHNTVLITQLERLIEERKNKDGNK